MAKICAKCGADIAQNAGFCPLCGFSASAKLPVAVPEKTPVQQSSERLAPQYTPQPKLQSQPQPQNSKKSPLGIIPIIIAAVMGIISIILLVLLLLPDNKCDFCGEKANNKHEVNDKSVVRLCDDCDSKCTICGKNENLNFIALSSGKYLRACNKCYSYIEQNRVHIPTSPDSSEFDGNNVFNPIISTPENTTNFTRPAETTTKPNTTNNAPVSIPGGNNDAPTKPPVSGTNPSTTTTRPEKTTSPNNTNIRHKTDGKLIYKGCTVEVHDFVSTGSSTTTKFKVTDVDPEVSDNYVLINYRVYDANGEILKADGKLNVSFDAKPTKGTVSKAVSLDLPDNAATVEFFASPNS